MLELPQPDGKLKMQKKLSFRLPAALFLLAFSTVLLAADGPYDKAIKARQAMFQLYSFNIGILGAMAKGDRDYDADVAREAAENLQLVPYLKSGQHFPLLLKRLMR